MNNEKRLPCPRIGVCCGPGSFAPEVKNQAPEPISKLMQTLTEARIDFAEFAVGAVTPDEPDCVFEKLREDVAKFPIKVEAYNSFIPAKYPVTGPRADLKAVLGYCSRALPRCRALGGEVIVLGSSGARRYPDDFPKEKAEAQFLEFCRELMPIADANKITIALEPLNHVEDNLCFSVAHGAQLVDAVKHPRFQLLADMYHIAINRESYEDIFKAGSRLLHIHVADVGRAAPGFGAPGEENFIGLFKILKAVNFKGRLSFEGKFENIHAQCAPLAAFLRKRWEQAD